MGLEFKNVSKREWKKEAEECFDFALAKIRSEYRDVKINSLVKYKIMNDYYNYCVAFAFNFVNGSLDSFEKAACLMTAINKNKILFYGDNQLKDIGKVIFENNFISNSGYKDGGTLKAELSVEAALRMCENPVCYEGKKYDVPKYLDSFNISKFIEEYGDEWKGLKRELINASFFSEGNFNETLHKYLTLKYLYMYVNYKLNIVNDIDNISGVSNDQKLNNLFDSSSIEVEDVDTHDLMISSSLNVEEVAVETVKEKKLGKMFKPSKK